MGADVKAGCYPMRRGASRFFYAQRRKWIGSGSIAVGRR
jgi:hypothetical protein